MAKLTAATKTLLEAFRDHSRFDQWKTRFLPLVLTLVLCGLNVLPHQVAQATPALQPDRFKVSPKVLQALQQEDSVPVIVSLVDPVAITAESSLRAQQVQLVGNTVLARVSATDFRPYRKYSHVPAIAGQANAQAIAALQINPQVAFIQIDETVHTHLGQSVPAIGADVVHNTYNFTGQNVRVAVLDTGIDTSHLDLSSSLLFQHCFSQGSAMTGDCLPGRTTESISAKDENGHGSNVSGIITSDGVVSSVGFAPGAGIVAIRVLDSHGSGWVSDWIAGLNWIIANQSTLQIKIINMSLGTNSLFAGNCDSQQFTTANVLAQIHNLGITVFASSGNAGSYTTIASPACNSYVVAVGATYDSNVGRQPPNPYANYQAFFNASWPACLDASTSLQTITCFTNSDSNLDIVAPGAPITSDYLNGGLATFYGTSQASPTAAGVAALMLQAAPNLTPDQIEATLKSTGTLVTEIHNGLQFPLINALAAIQAFTPQTPTLLAPGASIADPRPNFTWSAVTYATKYEMRLGQQDPPTVVVFSGNATSFRPTTPLIVGTYYWQVRALNGLLASPWSTPAQPLLIESPPDSVPPRNYFTIPNPTLTWNRVTDAIRYEVQVADNYLFTGATTEDADNNLSLLWPTPLTDGVYYWHVRACKTLAASSCSMWSAYDSFVIDVP